MTTMADELLTMAQRGSVPHEGALILLREVGEGTRYVATPEVIEIAQELSVQPERPSPVPVAEVTWLEGVVVGPPDEASVRCGLILRPDGVGCVILSGMGKWGVLPMVHNLPFTWDVVEDRPAAKERAMIILGYMMTLLAMIQQPRIVDAVERRPDRALQDARRRRGKAELVSYREVRVHVTRPEREADARAEEAIRAGKRLHRVRAHYKTQRGRIIKIASYWRGDASRGVVLAKSHRVVV